MKPASKKKLSLTTETLRTLSNDELVDVAGAGFGNITNSCFCNSAVCSIAGNCNITSPTPPPPTPNPPNRTLLPQR